MEHLYFEGIANPPRRRRFAATVAPRVRAVDRVAMDSFLVWLLEQARLDVTHYRARCFMRRLTACMRQLRTRTPEDARRLLESRPELLPVALDSVLLGVTEFFRDPAVFQCLRTLVLPTLREDKETLRIWSAACSDGPELYSIAMILAERGELAGAELLGTDCRPTAIRRAASGLYPEDAVKSVGAAYRRFFDPAGPLVRVNHELRDATRWIVQDLFTAPARGPWDMILWRNMSIYLETDAAEALWHSLSSQLRPGGFLVAGRADHPPRELGWARVAPCIYRKPMSLS